jgi:nucleotide-binding universal stress UspA family protein
VFTQIVVANDGSDGGFRALTMACELAKRCDAAVHMISVEELPDFPASIWKTTNFTMFWNGRARCPKPQVSI